MKTLGVEGEWEGIGHCAVGYVDGDYPSAPPRKEQQGVLGWNNCTNKRSRYKIVPQDTIL